MTDKELWRKLDALTTEPSITKKLAGFVALLRVAYEDNLDLICMCVPHEEDRTLVYHAFIGEKDDRWMMCYTSIRHAKMEFREGGDWERLSAQFVMNNMFNKSVISGLVFNSDDEDAMVMIPKALLEQALPGDHPKPEMFKEPD